jgi:Ni/Fe-hydrogenase subunit HybB-like protein
MNPQDEARLRNPAVTGGRTLMLICLVLTLAGAVAFVIGVSGAHPGRAWQAYLVNFVFWTGLSSGALLFSAVLTMTSARWGRPLKRLAEALGAFLPLAFVLFWVLYWGKDLIFPWIQEPIPAKAAWLNVGFLFLRDGLALLVLAGVGTALVWVSVRRDLVPDRPAATAPVHPPAETDRALVILAPVYGICYAFLLTLLAFDLIMSLSPHWFSALFGAYYFMGSFYTGLAAVMLLGVIASRRMGLGSVIGRPQFHDLGKLIFAFCVVTADFFFTQFFVQWYGNLPEETEFIIHRIYYAPWETVAWAVLIVCFAVPFILLLSRKLKTMPTFMFALCSLILAGMWLERFFLVSPSIWKEHELPLGVSEVLITAGFFGAAALCTLLFLRRFPALPWGDPFFRSTIDPHGGKP